VVGQTVRSDLSRSKEALLSGKLITLIRMESLPFALVTIANSSAVEVMKVSAEFGRLEAESWSVI
jgi:hypothetical protein